MPARPVRSGKLTVYLDTSTLCDAVRAHLVSTASAADRTYASLMPLLERVAAEANLCLSQVHLFELSRWGDRATADAIARWLDAVPTVWTRSLTDVQDDEDEYWSSVALGGPAVASVCAFAPSMIAAIATPDPSSSPALLGAPRLPEVLNLYRKLDLSHIRPQMLSLVGVAHADRLWAGKQGWSAREKSERLGYKRRVDLRKRAHAAYTRMVSRGLAIASTGADGQHVSDLLVSLVEHQADAMPSWRIGTEFSANWNDLAGRRTPGSKRANGLSSSFEDYVHLGVGGAYCQVFTCDADVSSCIGPDIRRGFGLSRQLSVRDAGGPVEFVARLTSELESRL